MEQTPEVGKVNNPEIFLGLCFQKVSRIPVSDWPRHLKALISWIILDLSY